MFRETSCQAVVLKKQPFNEGDEIITFFSRELGKIRCLAKSVKSPKSKLQQKLQGLFLVSLSITQNGRLQKIISVEPLEVFSQMRENLEALKRAFYAQELVLKFTADEHKNEPLFNLLVELLSFLNEQHSEAIMDLGLIKFKLEVLKTLGLSVHYQVRAGDDQQIFFSSTKGGFVKEASADSFKVQSPAYGLFLELLAEGFKKLESIRNTRGAKELQNLLSQFIEYQLERKVKSEKFLRD